MKSSKTFLNRYSDRIKLSEFVKSILPSNATVNFILEADFNGDGRQEVVLGYRVYESSSYQVILYLYNNRGKQEYSMLLSTEEGTPYWGLGVYDGAFAADTTGNKKPDLVLALTVGAGHFVTILVFQWINNSPSLLWQSTQSYYHGSVSVAEEDNKGTYGILSEWSEYSDDDIIVQCEAFIHIRMSMLYKFNGTTFVPSPRPVSRDRQVYNVADRFITSLAKKDYEAAYKMILLPFFFKLGGLDDSSPATFKRYVNKEVIPALERNIKDGDRIYPGEPSATYISFKGKYDIFNMNIELDTEGAKIASIHVEGVSEN